MTIFASQIRAARGLLDMSQAELSLKTGVSLQTIKNYENSDDAIKKASISTIEKIKTVLEDKGVKFVLVREDGKILEAGVRLVLEKVV